MAAAAHNPKFAAKAGIPQSVAEEFNAADAGKSREDLPEHVRKKVGKMLMERK